MGLTNQTQLLNQQLLYSPSDQSGFVDGDTFSMESNDGVHEDGDTIFEVDDFDRELLAESVSDD